MDAERDRVDGAYTGTGAVSASNPCSVRRLEATDDLEALTALLHRAYRVLGDAGLNYTAVDQDVETTRSRMRGADSHVAVVDRRVVGTVLLHGDDPHRPACAREPDMAYVSQFAVEPALQSRGIGSALLDHVERAARQRGFRSLALDTAEPAAHLVRFYSRRGYAVIGHVRFPGKTYRSVVMARSLADRVRGLVELQLEVLLTLDARGRLLATRDPVPRPAPRLLLSRSAEGNAWATRFDLDPGLVAALEALCAAEPRPARPAANGPPVCRRRVLELLSPVVREYRGPCFVLPHDLPQDGRARRIGAEERFDWVDAFPWLAHEFDAVAPVAIAFDGAHPAAICHSPRGRTAQVAEAGVETLPPFRGRGLARAAVACWGRAVQSEGRLALYSTSWENRASLRIAERLSARLYAENWHVT